MFFQLNLASLRGSPSRCFPVHCASRQTQGHKSSYEPTRTQAHRRALAHAQKPSAETEIPADRQCPELAEGGGRRTRTRAVDSQLSPPPALPPTEAACCGLQLLRGENRGCCINFRLRKEVLAHAWTRSIEEDVTKDSPLPSPKSPGGSQRA